MNYVEEPTLADAVKRLRAATGLSLANVSTRSAVSIPYINKIENGLKQNPSHEIVHALDKALDAGGYLAAFACEDDPMKRRSLFSVITAMAAGGGEYARLMEGIVQPLPRRVGLSDVRAVAQSVEFCTSLDLQYGGGAAVGPARSVLGWALKLLDLEMTDATRVRLSAEVAALADRVAWSNYDAGHDSAAAGLYGVALSIAPKGKDDNLSAHILIDASTRESHNGNHGEAASLLRSALDRTSLLPTVRANVGMTYARHIANMGHQKEALEQVKRAFEHNAQFDPSQVPDWSKGFLANPAHLASVASRSYLFAGDYDNAIAGFTKALEQLGDSRGRGRAYASSLLSLAYLRGGHEDQAVNTATALASASAGLKSIRVAGHMRVLAAELGRTRHTEVAYSVRLAATDVDPAP